MAYNVLKDYVLNNETMNQPPNNASIGLSTDPLSPLYFTLNMIIVVLVYVCNILTIWVVIRNKNLHTVTYTFTVSLSVSDLLIAFILPLCSILNHTRLILNNTERKYTCLTCKTFTTISTASSLLNLFMLAVDRYISVFYSLKYMTIMRQKRANVMILLSWAYVCIGVIVSIWGFHVWRRNEYCSLVRIVPVYLYIMIGPLNIGLFLIATLVLYGRIFHVAHKQAREIARQTECVRPRNKSGVQNRREYRVTKMMGLVLGVFLLCWTPYTVLNTVRGILRSVPSWYDIMYKLSISLLYANSFMNPIIYAWKNRTFRSAYKKLLGIPDNSVVSISSTGNHHGESSISKY